MRVVTEQNGSADSKGVCNCKIGRITDRYELFGVDDELVAYWTGEAEERYSTRRLATEVNQRVLRAALKEAGVPFKDGEVENTYRLLTDDDVSSGTRVQTRNELERDGVPIDRVESDFVSHQTVYNHLTDCLNASLESPSDEERIERSGQKLGALQNRIEAVTTDTIDQLKRNDVLEIGDADVTVSVTVTCNECLQEFTVRYLLEERSCACREADTDVN